MPVACEFRLAVRTLHAEKDRTYGSAWKRRGEVLSVVANVARKVDRIENLAVGAEPTRDESAVDTAVDLLVYSLKYQTYLADMDSSVAIKLFGEDVPPPYSDGSAGFDALLDRCDLSPLDRPAPRSPSPQRQSPWRSPPSSGASPWTARPRSARKVPPTSQPVQSPWPQRSGPLNRARTSSSSLYGESNRTGRADAVQLPLSISTCAMCTQPIEWTGEAWEHRGTGVWASAPVRHQASPVAPSLTSRVER